MKLLLTLTIFALILGAGIILAQPVVEEQPEGSETIDATEDIALDEDIQAEDLGVSEPNILPDSPFYFLKNLGRGIQSFFTFDPVKKAELKLKFANEKLIEVRKLVERKKNAEIIKKGLENYQNEIDEIKIAAEKIKEKATDSPKVATFLDKFTKHQILHHRILQKLETQVPAEVFERIREVREIHIERFGEVMIRLENKENIQARLEKNLEEIKGSDFKEFKNLEILKELEEKVPEAAKEAIQKAQETSLIRLKTNLEQMSSGKLDKFKEYIEKSSGAKEKQMEILEDLRMEAPKLQQRIIESKDIILEKIKLKEAERTEEKPQACIALWDPVCGKDSKTYSNVCFAKLAGTEIDYKGTCKRQLQQFRQLSPEVKSINP